MCKFFKSTLSRIVPKNEKSENEYMKNQSVIGEKEREGGGGKGRSGTKTFGWIPIELSFEQKCENSFKAKF